MELFYAILTIAVALAITAMIFLKGNLTTMALFLVPIFVTPLIVYGITVSVTKSEDENYFEFINGSEKSVEAISLECTRDGRCSNTYECDPYTVVETETYLDSEGDMQVRLVTVTKHHSCPYSQQETTYNITTTLGDFTAAKSAMTGEPFRATRSIPGGKVETPPQLWLEAQNRINEGNPGGVTRQVSYKNFILSSESNLFKKYSDKIDEYSEAHLLPKPADDIIDLYKTSKVYNVSNFDASVITEQLPYVNAVFGSQLHGDLHIVFVDSKKANDPTDYTNALNAYWISEDVGKNSIAKNSFTIVVGVDTQPQPEKPKETEPVYNENGELIAPEETQTIEVEKPAIEPGTPIAKWVKTFTGMPLGNEALMTQLESDLKGKPLDSKFLGQPVYNPTADTYTLGEGEIVEKLFGPNQFLRLSMTSVDGTDEGSGFDYLSESWQPSEHTMNFVFILTSILTFILLAGASVLSLGYRDGDDYVTKYVKKTFHI